MRQQFGFFYLQEYEQVQILPMAVFRDGTGPLRPPQVGACSFAERRDALNGARDNRTEYFVIPSHNFEMRKQRSSEPDALVVARFEHLCAFLGTQRGQMEGIAMSQVPVAIGTPPNPPPAQASLSATLRRHGEQAVSRLFE